MLNIHISGNYYLRSDSRCLILSEKRIVKEGKKKGEEYFVDLSFHRTLSEVFNALVRRQVYISEATTFQELLDEHTEFTEALESKFGDFTIYKLREGIE